MIKPLADRVVIEPKSAETQTAAGMNRAVPGHFSTYPMEVKVGDVVLYGKYAGTEVTVEGQKYLIVRQSDILAVL